MPETAILAARFREEAAWFRLLAAAGRLERALKYNPNWHSQPRAPAGTPDGGRWTDGGGSAVDEEIIHLVQADPGQGYGIDLLEDEAAGGHAIRRHVGRSGRYLLDYVRTHQYTGLFIRHGVKRSGSFPSLAAASKLVNATLSRNRAIADMVGTGELDDAFVTAAFRAKTSIEAITDGYIQPYLRDTYGVGVYIVHDPTRRRGFRVHTAYPRNE